MRIDRQLKHGVTPSPSPQGGGESRCIEVAPRDLARCFADLADVAAPLLLAVSGGPDSMALMHAAADWAARRDDSPAVHVATVDHALRPESRREAEMVAAAAAALGLPHAILNWEGPRPTSRIQEKARGARYALLAAHARHIGATHILTAHHADDQAETVLLRLLHGSGIGGLAGMRRLSRLDDLWLARPLLALAKQDLVAFCRSRSIPFVEDPSNRDPRFERVRLREKASVLAGLGLDTAALVRLGRRMERAEAALETEADRIESRLAPARGPQVYEASLAAATEARPETALRLMRRAVAHVAEDAPIRLERLESLTEAVWAALRAGTMHRATLAGTCVSLDAQGVLRIVREPQRRRGIPQDAAPPD